MTQANVLPSDREAAAAMYDFVQTKTKTPHSAAHIEKTKREVLAGRWDKDEAVQAFARHRDASVRELVEACEPLNTEFARLERDYGFDRPEHQYQTIMLTLRDILRIRAALASAGAQP